jgi:uroporphyrinogen decarboxylase
MTHRERILAAISHQQPDWVPLDLGSTIDSSIVVEGYERLALRCGVEPKVELTNLMLRTVKVEEPVLKALDIDTRGVFMGAPDNSPARMVSDSEYIDLWGCTRVRPEGGYYYDQLEFPLSGDISIRDLAGYAWPDPDDPGWTRHLQSQLDWIRANTDCAAVVAVPAPMVHPTQYLRGFVDWYMDFIRDPKLLEALLDAVFEVNLQVCKNILSAVGDQADIILTADDLGTQNGPMVSHEHFVKHLRGRFETYFGTIHDMTPAKILFHTCGSVASMMDDLIGAGVDILNPIQVSAKGMDPVELNRKYGGKVVFWGAMDTQRVLPHGTVQDVKNMVEERIEQLGESGGYVLSAVHNIQPDVPTDNVVAMFEHAREYVPSFMKG